MLVQFIYLFINETGGFFLVNKLQEIMQQCFQQYWPFNNNNKNSPETTVVLSQSKHIQ